MINFRYLIYLQITALALVLDFELISGKSYLVQDLLNSNDRPLLNLTAEGLIKLYWKHPYTPYHATDTIQLSIYYKNCQNDISPPVQQLYVTIQSSGYTSRYYSLQFTTTMQNHSCSQISFNMVEHPYYNLLFLAFYALKQTRDSSFDYCLFYHPDISIYKAFRMSETQTITCLTYETQTQSMKISVQSSNPQIGSLIMPNITKIYASSQESTIVIEQNVTINLVMKTKYTIEYKSGVAIIEDMGRDNDIVNLTHYTDLQSWNDLNKNYDIGSYALTITFSQANKLYLRFPEKWSDYPANPPTFIFSRVSCYNVCKTCTEEQCQKECKSCNDCGNGNCKSCNAGSILYVDSNNLTSCITSCPPGYTSNANTLNSNGLQCYKCSIQNCISCKANEICGICDENLYLIDNKCQALPFGFYYNSTSIKFEKCRLGCNQCLETGCYECKSGFFLLPDIDQHICYPDPENLYSLEQFINGKDEPPELDPNDVMEYPSDESQETDRLLSIDFLDTNIQSQLESIDNQQFCVQEVLCPMKEEYDSFSQITRKLDTNGLSVSYSGRQKIQGEGMYIFRGPTTFSQSNSFTELKQMPQDQFAKGKTIVDLKQTSSTLLSKLKYTNTLINQLPNNHPNHNSLSEILLEIANGNFKYDEIMRKPNLGGFNRLKIYEQVSYNRITNVEFGKVKQGDENFKCLKIGIQQNFNKHIGSYGCLIVSYSNMLSQDGIIVPIQKPTTLNNCKYTDKKISILTNPCTPPILNEYLKANPGYFQSNSASLYSSQFNLFGYQNIDWKNDKSKLKQYIQDPNYAVILEVASISKPSDLTKSHYVLAIKMVDSETALVSNPGVSESKNSPLKLQNINEVRAKTKVLKRPNRIIDFRKVEELNQDIAGNHDYQVLVIYRSQSNQKDILTYILGSLDYSKMITENKAFELELLDPKTKQISKMGTQKTQSGITYSLDSFILYQQASAILPNAKESSSQEVSTAQDFIKSLRDPSYNQYCSFKQEYKQAICYDNYIEQISQSLLKSQCKLTNGKYICPQSACESFLSSQIGSVSDNLVQSYKQTYFKDLSMNSPVMLAIIYIEYTFGKDTLAKVEDFWNMIKSQSYIQAADLFRSSKFYTFLEPSIQTVLYFISKTNKLMNPSIKVQPITESSSCLSPSLPDQSADPTFQETVKVVASDCSGNSRLGLSERCFCQASPPPINVEELCSQVEIWDKSCCSCVINEISRANPSYQYQSSTSKQYFVGLFSIHQDYWSPQYCNVKGEQLCDPIVNLQCAKTIYKLKDSWKYWKSIQSKCPSSCPFTEQKTINKSPQPTPEGFNPSCKVLSNSEFKTYLKKVEDVNGPALSAQVAPERDEQGNKVYNIGWGHKIQTQEQKDRFLVRKESISVGEAELFFKQDIEYWCNQAKAVVDKNEKYWDKFKTYQQGVLVDIGYNMGTRGLIQFKKLRQACKDDNFESMKKEAMRFYKKERSGPAIPLTFRVDALRKWMDSEYKKQ